MKINRDGNIGIYAAGATCASFEITGRTYKTASPGILPLNSNYQRTLPVRIGDFDIIPNGQENKYPDEIREILDDNNLVEEQLRKKVNLVWGQGPALYKRKIENGVISREYVDDREIQEWLDSFNYENYLQLSLTDLRVMNSFFDKMRFTRNVRLGEKGRIVSVEYVDYQDCRLEWNNLEMPERIIVGDYLRPWITGLTAYPIYNNSTPNKFEVAMNYHCLPQFMLRKTYSLSSFHGSINWIKNGSTVAKLLLALNLNTSAIKMHLKIPQKLIENKIEEIRTKAAEARIIKTEPQIQEEINAYIGAIIDTVSGSSNVGKLLQTIEVFDEAANEMVSVQVEPIDLKIKEYIDAQINIAKRAAFETSAGIGLHPALSNLTHEGNLPSGSEQLYAYKLFLMTDIDVVERINMRTINWAIKYNFPGKNLQLGYYHTAVMTESEVTPSKRVKNTTPNE